MNLTKLNNFFSRKRRERSLKIACAISRDEILIQLMLIMNKGTWPGQVRILGNIFKNQGRSFSSRSHWLPLVYPGNLTVTSKNCSLVTTGLMRVVGFTGQSQICNRDSVPSATCNQRTYLKSRHLLLVLVLFLCELFFVAQLNL